jgi:hypothetical protein
MNPRSVVPSILEKLEPHLERLELVWSAQPQDDRAPTLPLTPEGKVNVRQLVRDLGLRETLEQHFFRKPELAGPVNALAKVQGVKPIGSRLLDDVADAGVRKRLGRDADTISELRKALAEREDRRLHALAPGLTPRSVFEKFAAVQMIDVSIPTTDGRTLTLTRYTEPEPELKLLLEKLKLELPQQPPPKITALQLPSPTSL